MVSAGPLQLDCYIVDSFRLHPCKILCTRVWEQYLHKSAWAITAYIYTDLSETLLCSPEEPRLRSSLTGILWQLAISPYEQGSGTPPGSKCPLKAGKLGPSALAAAAFQLPLELQGPECYSSYSALDGAEVSFQRLGI